MICDSSGSMAYRGQKAWGSKFECSCILAAALSWLTLRQNDSVGLFSLRARSVSPVRHSNSASTARDAAWAGNCSTWVLTRGNASSGRPCRSANPAARTGRLGDQRLMAAMHAVKIA